jgi:hypothetical protein
MGEKLFLSGYTYIGATALRVTLEFFRGRVNPSTFLLFLKNYSD